MKMPKSLIIDPQFKNLIPPLQRTEYLQLEENLLADGCRDPLTQVFVSNAKNRATFHPGHMAQDTLDLGRIHGEAATEHDVFFAIDHKKPVVLEPADIAGREPRPGR